MLHVYLIVHNIKSIIQQHPVSANININFSLTCMKMIKPATGYFDIVEVTAFDLNQVTSNNDEYIDNSSVRVSQLFNNTCLCRYLCPCKFVFDNISEFKPNFNTLIKYFNINSVLMTVNNPQSNALVEMTNQVIYKMLDTEDLYNNS